MTQTLSIPKDILVRYSQKGMKEHNKRRKGRNSTGLFLNPEKKVTRASL